MSSFGLAFTSALVDFVWQGALVALALHAALYTLGRRSAQIRYGLCLLALATLMALPVLTTASRFETGASFHHEVSGTPITVIPRTSNGLRVEALIRSAAAPSVISTIQPWILPVWWRSYATATRTLSGTLDAWTLPPGGNPIPKGPGC